MDQTDPGAPRAAPAPPRHLGRAARLAARIAIILAALAFGAWTVTALWYQADAPWRVPLMTLAGLATLGLMVATPRRPVRAMAALAIAVVGVGLWWSAIAPSNTRDWAPDVAHGVTADISGSRVTLHHVRNFEWRTPTTFTPNWDTRAFDLDALERVDVYSSVWASPAIAHTLVGFGFSDGQYVVFSAEIRRQAGETFSEIGGFFKQFELVLIAATPDDIIRLRTDVRGEHVARYPLKLTGAQMHAAFLTFAGKGNALAEQPEFYQTLTTNCTTVLFHLARLVAPSMPFDWRILASGHLPAYLYAHGLIDTEKPLAEVESDAAVAPGSRPWARAR